MIAVEKGMVVKIIVVGKGMVVEMIVVGQGAAVEMVAVGQGVTVEMIAVGERVVVEMIAVGGGASNSVSDVFPAQSDVETVTGKLEVIALWEKGQHLGQNARFRGPFASAVG